MIYVNYGVKCCLNQRLFIFAKTVIPRFYIMKTVWPIAFLLVKHSVSLSEWQHIFSILCTFSTNLHNIYGKLYLEQKPV